MNCIINISVNLVEKYTIDGHKALVFDDVMSPEQVDKWRNQKQDLKFYPTKFNQNNTRQYIAGTNFAVTPVFAEQRETLFSTQEWIMPYLNEFDERIKYSDFQRSFINRYTKGCHCEAHKDINEFKGSDDFYAVGLMFVSIEDDTDVEHNGFILHSDDYTQEVIVPHKFNRMMLFDARIIHAPQIPNCGFERLTYYFGFSNFSPMLRPQQEQRKFYLHHMIPNTTYLVDINNPISH